MCTDTADLNLHCLYKTKTNFLTEWLIYNIMRCNLKLSISLTFIKGDALDRDDRPQADRAGHENPKEECGWHHKTGGVYW